MRRCSDVVVAIAASISYPGLVDARVLEKAIKSIDIAKFVIGKVVLGLEIAWVAVLRISQGLIVSHIGSKATHLISRRRSDLIEDLLDLGDVLLGVVVAVGSALAVALGALVATTLIVTSAGVGAAPAEPSSVSRIDVHIDVGYCGQGLQSILDTFEVAQLGSLGAVRFYVKIGGQVGKRVWLDDSHDLYGRELFKN